ncbi:hypothetical protein WDW37_17625 [Bdellovibrionota bacterium FG-1]
MTVILGMCCGESTDFQAWAITELDMFSAKNLPNCDCTNAARNSSEAFNPSTFASLIRLRTFGQLLRIPRMHGLKPGVVEARKGGVKTTNPFTGEPMITKARPATKKPRWSFPKTLKETFANKKHW